MKKQIGVALAALLVMAVAVPTYAADATFVPYSGKDTILATDAKNKKVTVALIAAQGDVAMGMNFNGYSNGDLQIQVPTGWKVKVTMKVGSGSMAHSALIVPWTEKAQKSKWTLAFSHSAVADYTSGIEAGDAPQSFTITASKAGQYALICGVPGHIKKGMWDEFDVVDGLTAPQVLVKK